MNRSGADIQWSSLRSPVTCSNYLLWRSIWREDFALFLFNYLIPLSHSGIRQAATSKFSVVFSSLLEVADDRAMVTADPHWSLGPFCDHLVTERFSVVFYQSANAVRWFSVVGVRFHWSLAVGDHSLSVTGWWPWSLTSRRPLSDRPEYHQIFIFVGDRLAIGRGDLWKTTIHRTATCWD